MMRRGRPGLIGMAARTAVVAGTATAVSNRVAHRQQQKYAAQEAPPPAAPAPGPAPAAGGEDIVEKIKELASLHDAGALSDAEFEAAKAQLLG
jgi:hypothetical protein